MFFECFLDDGNLIGITALTDVWNAFKNLHGTPFLCVNAYTRESVQE
jgi:hypothetical protein